jgi:hypothetical protein
MTRLVAAIFEIDHLAPVDRALAQAAGGTATQLG